jgi:polyhydroxybutyrate depolymerase
MSWKAFPSGAMAVVMVIAMGVVVTACAESPEEGAASAEPLAARVGAAGDGCGEPPPLTPGESGMRTVRVGELERQYWLHLPPDYDPSLPTPLVLDFHGYTGTAESEEVYTGLSAHADRPGFVVVYPQGTSFVAPDGNRVTSWNDLAGSKPAGPEGPICSETAFEYPFPPECGEPTRCTWATCHDDLAFIEQLLDVLEGTLCVDLDRVFASGMSNGGMFTHRLGCDMAERFAAIAPVGGTLARGFNCAPSTPLSMMNIYGARDDYVSQKGVVSSDGYYYTGAQALLDRWASADAQDCNPEATPYATTQDGELGLVCVQRANCASGAEVVHCEWDGAHDWPAAEGRPVGNEIIWEFFAENSR